MINVTRGLEPFSVARQANAREIKSMLLQRLVQSLPRQEVAELVRSSRDVLKSLAPAVREKLVDGKGPKKLPQSQRSSRVIEIRYHGRN